MEPREALLAAGVAVVAAVAITDLVLRLRDARRRKRTVADTDAQRRRNAAVIAHHMMKSFGLIQVHPVAVDDIKCGDHIYWQSDDQTQVQEYIAGYNGDPGPSAGGRHGREHVHGVDE